MFRVRSGRDFDGTKESKTIDWTINKAANTLKINAKTATFKSSTKGKKGKLKKTKKLAFVKTSGNAKMSWRT